MALLLDDIYQEMKLALVKDLSAKCDSSTDALVSMYNQYRDTNDAPVYDINNNGQLAELIALGMTAKDIAGLYSQGTNYVSKNAMGNIEATSTDGLKAKVMTKAGKHLAEVIRNPQSDTELYNKCVGTILAPYFETLANQNK